jgi:hypothetical protein
VRYDARPDHVGAAAHVEHAIRSLVHRMPPGPSDPQVTWAVLGHLRPMGLDLARALRVLADRTCGDDEDSRSTWSSDARSHLVAAAHLCEQLSWELHLAMDDLRDHGHTAPSPDRHGARRILRRR